MRLLFLDFNGVIWTVPGDLLANKLNAKNRRELLDPTRIVLLERLLEKHPDVRVVVSSTWRMGRSVAELRRILGPKIGKRVIGKTVIMRDSKGNSVQRSKEIIHFLKNFDKHPVIDYIVLDDDADMKGVAKHWFKCSCWDGMTFQIYSQIDHYLAQDTLSFTARKIRLTNWLTWASIIVKYYLYRKHLNSITWRIRGWLK